MLEKLRYTTLLFLCIPIVLFSPFSCATDITGVTVSDRSGVSHSLVPVTFGQVFAPGDLPAGSGLSIRNAGTGAPVESQLDIKARHGDGSVRHGIVTLMLSTLQANAAVDLVLASAAAGNSGAALPLSSLSAAQKDVQVEITLGGVQYRADLASALQSDTPLQWLAGSLAGEWILAAPLVAADGSVHPHLAVRFSVRAYRDGDSVRVDVSMENNWTLVAGAANQVYDVRIVAAGQTVFSRSGLEHFHQSRWRHSFWLGTPSEVFVALDRNYLMSTGAVPNYELLPVSAQALNQEAAVSYEPMSNVSLQAYMPGTGANPAIGPLPRWAARYLVSMDPRAWDSLLANGNAGGSYSIHYRDENTGLPVTVSDHPDLFPRFLNTCGGDCSNPYTADMAHQPSIAYLPYLVTGDYFYLEELQFWASFNVISILPETRGFAAGLFHDQNQVRSQAWGMRTLARAAYITPDSHPLKSYYHQLVLANIAAFADKYNLNPAANDLGWAYASQAFTDMRPWQDDFLTWTMGHINELGYSGVQPFFNWKARYPVSRMADDSGYCWIFAGVYLNSVGYSPDDPQQWYGSIGELYYQNFGKLVNSAGRLADLPCGGQEMADWLTIHKGRTYRAGEMDGYADSPTGFPSNMRPALALAAENGMAGAEQAWNRLQTAPVSPDYGDDPQFNIVPRAVTPGVPAANYFDYQIPSQVVTSTVAADAGGAYGPFFSLLLSLVLVLFRVGQRRQLRSMSA